jgi:hypothetical protein
VTDQALHWQGRVLRVAVGPRQTTVTLLDGPAVPVSWPAGSAVLRAARPLAIPTRRPDLAPTADLARCRPVLADPATTEPAEAAADGTDTLPLVVGELSVQAG